MSNCVSCPTDFTFDSVNTVCLTPDTAQINTLESSYKFYGFSVAPGWNGGSATNYGFVTVLSGGSSSQIYKDFTFSSAHYNYRLLVSGWWLSGSNPINCMFYKKITSTSPPLITLTHYKTEILAAPAAVTSNRTGTSSFTAYPVGSLATNIDYNFDD